MNKESKLPIIAVGCKCKPFVVVWTSSIHPAFAELTNLFVSCNCVQELTLFLQLGYNEKYLDSCHMHVLEACPLVSNDAFAFTQREEESKLIYLYIKYQPSPRQQAKLLMYKVSFLE